MTIMRDSYLHAMKTGDREPSIRRKLLSATSGDPIDLAGASAKFIMKDSAGNEAVNAAAVIETPTTTGVVRYDWQAGDTSEEGTFEAEFQIVFSGGNVYTMPNDGYIIVKITEQLGS